MRTDRLAKEVAGLVADPAPNGRTIFPNPSAKGPFDGDYIFQIRDGDRFLRMRFILDRKVMRLTIVAITRLPLMM